MTITADQPSAPVAGLPPVQAPRIRDTRWELAAALRTFGRLGYEAEILAFIVAAAGSRS